MLIKYEGCPHDAQRCRLATGWNSCLSSPATNQVYERDYEVSENFLMNGLPFDQCPIDNF